MVGGFLVTDALARGIYNCDRDPYFRETCVGRNIAYVALMVAPWLVATYLLARHQAISFFACVFLGLMWWCGLLANAVLLAVIFPAPPAGDDYFSGFGFWDFWGFFVLGGMVALEIVGGLTAIVGSVMEAVVRALQKRHAPSAPSPVGTP